MKPFFTHVALQVKDLDISIGFYQSFCGMNITQERVDRVAGGETRVVWMAEPGRESELIFVLMPGNSALPQAPSDYSHLGFALKTREEVDAVAAQASDAGCLQWAPTQEPYPVGYYCGVRDPDGRFIEFSYGQPLGPGANLDTE
jgi:catechol 2,3-dioxygenase-like lactoylglutathione lyase family enzyme